MSARLSRLLPKASCLSVGLCLLAMAPSTEAQAEDIADASAVFLRACRDRQGDEISHLRLGEALLIESGRIPAEFVRDRLATPDPDRPPTQLYEEALLSRLGEIGRSEGPHPADDEYELNSAIELMELQLSQTVGSAGATLAISAAPGERPWLFQTNPPTWTLRCKDAPRTTLIQEIEDNPGRRRFVIRGKPEELALTGQEARSADALNVGFERTRSETDTGDTETDTTFSINGTLGIRLSPQSAMEPSFLFARYSLQRVRTDPSPILPPGSSQSDDDTHALELGTLAHFELLGNESTFKLFTNIQASSVFDFANDSTRLRLRSTIEPAHPDVRLGLCRLGSFKSLGDGAAFGRCSLQFEVEAAHLLDNGTTPLGDFDSFLAAGARGRFELFIPTSDDPGTGLLGTVSYRFLPVLHGRFDSIRRFEAQISHRFWTSAGPGIDVGFSYLRGRNELSFEEEDILRFGIGIVL